MKKINITIVFVLLLCSCASKKDILYFQNLSDYSSKPDTSKNVVIIKKNDKLAILVSSEDERAVIPFNGVANNKTSSLEVRSNQIIEPEYIVNEEGFIVFPILGKLKVANKTKSEVVDLLESKLSAYIKQPEVSLRISNFKISVLGEVNQPGLYPIDGNRLTILEALSLAGDMTIKGKRDDVLLIREENGKTIYNSIDFTKGDLFYSPYYYLQQNDVIVVSPNNAQIQQSKNTIKNISSISGILSLIVSVAAILTR
ncbi:polysaccharide biosynthesis/export family protein [Aquimarina agarilytica]|uniref:polysaccharide biosynthesis/export family protein n=1 Tax=Aquimarina agarilytica TaxID=1087449 RepID=UPI000289DB4A|nr:polysaccharide biosynthesis/export family protein [Aquimarina agarilytica]